VTTDRQHAAPPSDLPPTPEPPFPERVRTLVHRARTGTLATLSRHRPGFPFASVMPFGLDPAGDPVVLVSSMAMHTQNLASDGRASLLVAQAGWEDDPLAGSRVTLMGTAVRLAGDAAAAVRDPYLARHPNARYWVDFDDFAFWRLAVADLYLVAGFGAMGWVTADDYRVATPDPLADVADAIIGHMNADHADALVLICAHVGGASVDAATMTSVDRMGFRVRARTGERMHGMRINFPTEVRTSEDARRVFVGMVRGARSAAPPASA
jgi:putative heme iron utilization protein